MRSPPPHGTSPLIAPAMRIAYVCADPDVPVFGSAESAARVQATLRGFVRQGATVDLFSPRLEGEVPAELLAVRAHRLPTPPPGDPDLQERAAQFANGSLWSALWRMGPFDLVYERYSLWSFAAFMYARLQQIPSLVEVTAPLVDEGASRGRLIDRARAAETAARVFGSATAILAASARAAEYAARYPGAAATIHVLPGAVDTERFSAAVAPSRPAEPGVFTVGYVASPKRGDGLELLARSVALLHGIDGGVRLLIVGGGPEGELLRLLCRRNGIGEAVVDAGAVRDAEIPGLLASMDVAVFPGVDGEGCDGEVLACMAAGLPVVASGAGPIRECIEEGVSGLLFAPGDVSALTSSLGRIRTDRDLRAQLGAAARHRVLRDHEPAAKALRILELAGLSLTVAPPLPA